MHTIFFKLHTFVMYYALFMLRDSFVLPNCDAKNIDLRNIWKRREMGWFVIIHETIHMKHLAFNNKKYIKRIKHFFCFWDERWNFITVTNMFLRLLHYFLFGKGKLSILCNEIEFYNQSLGENFSNFGYKIVKH